MLPVPSDAGAGDVSASAIAATTATGNHVLKIDHYSWMKVTTPNGGRVRSCSFRIGGCTWHIDVYPNGYGPESAGFVSLFLVLDDLAANAAAAAECAFAILDLAGEPVPRYTVVGAMRELAAGQGTSVQWGAERFIAAEELEKSEHYVKVDGDSFSVRCDVTVVDGFRAGPRLIAVPPPDLPRHLHDLLASEQGADVRFRVCGETFAAHRCVLAARSPVFKAALFGAMKESSTSTADFVQVDGVRADVFKTLLDFMYTDALPPETKKKGQEEEDEAAMAQHLLVAADRYGMERLKLICESRLCRHIGVSTAATTLVLAEQHRCHGLKRRALSFSRPRRRWRR